MPCVESGARRGCERHLANGVQANGKPTSPYPAWGVARSRPCHVIPLAGLAGVYARRARVGLRHWLLPMSSPGFVARSQVLSGPNVQSVQRGAAGPIWCFAARVSAPTGQPAPVRLTL